MESPEPEVSAATEVKEHLDAMWDLWRDLCNEHDRLKKELDRSELPNAKEVEIARHLAAMLYLWQDLNKENDQLKEEIKELKREASTEAETDGASANPAEEVPPGPLKDDTQGGSR